MFLLRLIRKGSLNSVTFNEDKWQIFGVVIFVVTQLTSNQEEALRDELQNLVPRVSRFNDSKPLPRTECYVMKEQREKRQIKKLPVFL